MFWLICGSSDEDVTWVIIEDFRGRILDVQALAVSWVPSGEAAFSGRGGKASLYVGRASSSSPALVPAPAAEHIPKNKTKRHQSTYGCDCSFYESSEALKLQILTTTLLWQEPTAVLIEAFLRKYSDWAHGRNPTLTQSPSVPLKGQFIIFKCLATDTRAVYVIFRDLATGRA